MEWTKEDFSSVRNRTIITALILTLIAWLIFTIWLDKLTLIQCALGALVISWVRAILAQGKIIRERGN